MRLEAMFPLPLGVATNPSAAEDLASVLGFLGGEGRRFVTNESNLTYDEFHLHLQPCMTGLRRFFEESITTFVGGLGYKIPAIEITQCWLNVNRPGDRHHRHHHPNSFVSGVYYLEAPPECGSIIFHRPWVLEVEPDRAAPSPFTSDVVEQVPQPGLLLLFPSRIEHSVTANRSNLARMSVSFNTRLRGRIGTHLHEIDFG